MSSLSLIPLIPANFVGDLPNVIQQWKYSKKVEIDNVGCPTQINLLLNQDGCDVPPLLYVRLRGNGCKVRFCPTGEVELDDPILYSTSCRQNVLTTESAFALFEIVIPLATLAMELHKNGIKFPGCFTPQPPFFVQDRHHKRVRDEERDAETLVLEEGEVVTKNFDEKRVCREKVVTAN